MKLKKLILLIVVSIWFTIANAQKANILWGSMAVPGISLIENIATIEMENKYFNISIANEKMGKTHYVLLGFDEGLKFKRSVSFPENLIFVSLTKSNSQIVVLFKYYTTTGDNRFVLAKAVFDENLSKPLKFEKVEDIDIQKPLVPFHIVKLFFCNDQEDAIVMKVPREGYQSLTGTPQIYTFTSYNGDFTKKKWTANLDITKYANDFEISDGYFSDDEEFVFFMKARLKGFTMIKNNMLIGKFSKKKGLSIKEVPFDINDNTFNFGMQNESESNIVYLYGVLERKKSKEDWIFIKQFNLDNLEETFSSEISMGLKKENGFNTKIDFTNFKFRQVKKDKESGGYLIFGELYKDSRYNMTLSINNTGYMEVEGFNGPLVHLKLNSKGELINKIVIPKRQNVYSGSRYSSFIVSTTDDNVHFVFSDVEKNENLTVYKPNTKIKSVSDEVASNTYAVTIDKNYNVSKKKLTIRNSGVANKLNQNGNFEIKRTIFISENNFLVFEGLNIGLLTFE